MRAWFSGRTGMVLAFIAGCVVATGATAGAASLITGKQIKDGTITAKDLSKALRKQLAKAGVRGPKGDAGAKGDTGPSTGPAGGDLTGSYPNPALRAPELVAIKQQPLPPTAAINCQQTFDTLCGDPNIGSYWNQPDAGSSNPGYYVEPSGFIQFQGAVQEVGTPNIALFVLPPGHRPNAPLLVPVAERNNTAMASYVLIGTGGAVSIFAYTLENGDTFDLSGVRFHIGG